MVAGYGASATATVLIYHFNIDNLSFIVDDNPMRQQRYSPGHHFPVVGAAELVARRPAVVVALAWRFAEAIAAKCAPYLQQGGVLVVPLPTLRVIRG